MKPIQGKHIIDAMNLMSKSHKRCAVKILACLGQVRLHAIHKGMDPARLFVQSALVNKQRRKTKLYYHAKSRMGKMRCDTSSLLIRLEEKKPEIFFKMMVGGECPPGLAAAYREKLLEKDADLADIRSLQF